MPERLACACGAPVTHPSPHATRCPACEAEAQRRWFTWLATLPETRGLATCPNPDGYIHGEPPPIGWA